MMKAIVVFGWDLGNEFPKVIGGYQVLTCLFCEDAFFPEVDVQLYAFSIIAPFSRELGLTTKTVFDFIEDVRESKTAKEFWLCTCQPVSLDEWLIARGVTAVVDPVNLVSQLENWVARA